MFVYVVAAMGGAQPWKIGRTTDPPARLRSLQAHSPAPLAYVKIVEAHSSLEPALHRQFAQYRIHGEWFNIPPNLTEALLARLDGEPLVIKLPKSKGKGGHRRTGRTTVSKQTGERVKKMQPAEAAKKYVTPKDRRGNTRMVPDSFRIDGP